MLNTIYSTVTIFTIDINIIPAHSQKTYVSNLDPLIGIVL